jgi:phosphoadenosine phosphosulfate reductase
MSVAPSVSLSSDSPSTAEESSGQSWLRALAQRPTSAAEVLSLAESSFADSAVVATSFGPEDVVLLHLAREHAPSLSAFTIDTGRLPPETYELMEELRIGLGLTIQTYVPDHSAVEALVAEQGFFSFRGSIAARKSCCEIRKLEPLQRALAGKHAWVTGLRREQSVTRSDLAAVEWDAGNQLVKFSPLASWSRADVWAHIQEHKLPYNRLHDIGYASIGCAPCTRAIRPFEDERAGRWWWESAEHRECGLHRK